MKVMFVDEDDVLLERFDKVENVGIYDDGKGIKIWNTSDHVRKIIPRGDTKIIKIVVEEAKP